MAMPILAGLIVGLFLADPQASKTCSLLTSAEIEAAVGAKVDRTEPGEMQLPNNAGTVQTCTWAIRAQKAQIMMSSAHMPPGTDAKALAKNNAGMDALRAQKWTEESKDYGNAWCTVMSPPPSVKEPMYMSACTASPKGTLLSVTYLSPTKKLPLEQTKALLDKAAARVQ
jgi:hypothetical protein